MSDPLPSIPFNSPLSDGQQLPYLAMRRPARESRMTRFATSATWNLICLFAAAGSSGVVPR